MTNTNSGNRSLLNRLEFLYGECHTPREKAILRKAINLAAVHHYEWSERGADLMTRISCAHQIPLGSKTEGGVWWISSERVSNWLREFLDAAFTAGERMYALSILKQEGRAE